MITPVTLIPRTIHQDLLPTNDNITTTIHLHTNADFFADAAASTLPTYSLIDQRGAGTSEENPQNIVLGEAFVSKVVQALGAPPAWKDTVLINYDEHDRYYDHVPSPRALAPDDVTPIVEAGEIGYEGFTRYEFRVLFVLVSPYAKKDYVSHTAYDHTSILALVERKLNLQVMTRRDANANDFTDMIDWDAMARDEPNFPSIVDLHLADPGNKTARLACSVTGTGAGVIPPPGSVVYLR